MIKFFSPPANSFDAFTASMSYLEEQSKRNKTDAEPSAKTRINDVSAQKPENGSGDILTKVAIPRSGSFLNTGGLTRYKSKHSRKIISGKGQTCGGGSPLGFSELFQEFRLQENLHSLDEILNAIINSDGMSYNDLKPIYKEFLLKLAVTLTKDELYQRSKSIMRRQKKKKLKKQTKVVRSRLFKLDLTCKLPHFQTLKRPSFVSVVGLKKVFKLGHFRAKTPNKTSSKANQSIAKTKIKNKKSSYFRTATSGSELSVAGRNEHTINGHHRNSSSG